MRITFIVLSLFFAGNLFSQRNLKPYYFKLNQFEEPVVYVYHCEEKPDEDQYLLMASRGDSLFTTVYDADGQLSAIATEVYEKDYARLTYLMVFFPTGQDEIMEEEVQVIQPAVLMEWKPDDTFGYRIVDHYLGETIERRRTHKGKEKFRIGGKVQKMAVIIDQFSVPGNFEEAPESLYYYARGVGLIRMDLDYGDGEIHSLILTEMISAEEFDQRFGRR